MSPPPDSARPPRTAKASAGEAEQRTTIIGHSSPGVQHQPLLLDRRALARELRISVRLVDKLRARGALPAPLRLGQSVRWRRSEIEGWLAAGAPPQERWEARRREGRS